MGSPILVLDNNNNNPYNHIMTKENNKREVKCLRCKYYWTTELVRPKKCPMCSSYKWDEPKEKNGTE